MAKNSRRRRSRKRSITTLPKITKKRIQTPPQCDTLKPGYHGRVLRSSKSKINYKAIQRVISDRIVQYTPGKNDTAQDIRITCNVSMDKLESNYNHEIVDSTTLVDQNHTIVNNNNSITNTYKTIDCIDDNDVIFINEGDDSDVICLEPSEESTKLSKRALSEESVILIDDDSVVELPSTSSPAKNVNNPPVPSPNVNKNGVCKLRQFFTSTPAPVAQKSRCGIPAFFQDIRDITVDCGPNALPCYARKKAITKPNLQIRREININTEEKLNESLNNLNIFGLNFLNAGDIRTIGLRPIFIDGSNIAMGHTGGKFFSVRGLKICIDYFTLRGHEVIAIVPMFRKNKGQNSDPRLLFSLEKKGLVTFTPSRTVNGRHIVPYDDRYIVLLAHVHKGVIVSSDNYRDLLQENPNLLETIENRILNPTWVKDMIIFPSDPMGRNGPKLNDFLRFPH